MVGKSNYLTLFFDKNYINWTVRVIVLYTLVTELWDEELDLLRKIEFQLLPMSTTSSALPKINFLCNISISSLAA
jgi:hypothetical protein